MLPFFFYKNLVRGATESCIFYFSVSRPKPLSAFPKKAVTGTVLTRSTFINNVLSKIGEVWASHEPRNGISLYNRYCF